MTIVGPYAGAVLRFQITFPDAYPELPPLITFTSDIFHPLVVPLTQYTFSTSVVDTSSTVSASDEDRLPPGAFSLRYGFPEWFSRGHLSETKSYTTSVTDSDQPRPLKPGSPVRGSENRPEINQVGQDRKGIILAVLNHIQNAFENDGMLDSMPLEAAGDPSAWHAWRAHRGLARRDARPKSPRSPTLGSADDVPASPKHPGEWKWDGVWESRVNNGIEASIHESTLFGSTGSGRAGSIATEMSNMDPRQRMLATADRQIRFSKLSDERLEELKSEISTYGHAVPS